jgi:hypothetical protein
MRSGLLFEQTQGGASVKPGLNQRSTGKEQVMKKFVATTIIGLALVIGLTVAPASAQETSQKIYITRDSKVGAEPVAKGDYTVKFVEGKEGELVFVKGKREILTATYTTTKLEKAAADNSVIFTQNSDGTFQLKRIEFKGKDTALVFENAMAKSISK